MRNPRLHGSKSTALLQLCNCMSSCDLKNLEDLYNGDTFVNIISNMCPGFVEAEQSETNGDSIKNEQVDEKMSVPETKSKEVTAGDTMTRTIEDSNIDSNEQDDEKISVSEIKEVIAGDIMTRTIEAEYMDCNEQDDDKMSVSESKREKVTAEDTKNEIIEAEYVDSNEDDETMTGFEIETEEVAAEDTKIQIIETEYMDGLEVDTTCAPVEVSPVTVEIGITEEIIPNTHVDYVGSDEGHVLQNYRAIEKFIDDKYFLQSSDIISYKACMEGKELELSKVVCFVLSEVVRLCAFQPSNQLSTLALLDSKVQEDLEECFQLFIVEPKNLSKSSVEKMLCHQAKYKSSSPVIRNSFITPRRSCASKYRIDSPITPSTDDVFTNSPLKSFFESPVFKKEDLMRKDKEIALTRNILHEEELKADDLKSEINELKEKLHKKDDEMQKLKDTIKKMEESEKIKDEDIKKLMEEKEESTKELVAAKEKLDLENNDLRKEMCLLQKEVKDCLNGTCQSRNICREFMVMKKDLQREKDHSQKLFFELKETKEKLKMKMKELSDVNEQLQSVKFDLMKNESFYKEKLNEMKIDKKDEPNSPGSGETIGSIIEEENKMLRLKFNSAESKIKELEEKLEKFEMLEKDCIPTTHQNARVYSSMPDLVEITQNLQDQNEKELPHSLNACDTSNSNISKNSFQMCDNSTEAKIIAKNSFSECDISNNSSEVVSNNSFTVCDISMNSPFAEKKACNSEQRWADVPFSDPTVELYGTLWKNLNSDNGNKGSKNDLGSKNTIGSLTLCDFLNLLRISSIDVADRYNLGDIFADKKSDAEYLSSVLRGKKSKQNVSKLLKDFRVFKEMLSCLFIFVDSNTLLPSDNFYDWVKSLLENGHKKTKEESQLEKKVSDYADQLKSLAAKIDELELERAGLQREVNEYKELLEEKVKCIENLEMKNKKTEEVGKLYHTKYEKCKERVISMMEMEKENKSLRQKSKLDEIVKQKLEEKYQNLQKKWDDQMTRKYYKIEMFRNELKNALELNAIKDNTIKTLKLERDKYRLKVEKYQLANTLRSKDPASKSNPKPDVKKRDNNDLESVTEKSSGIKREQWNVSYLSESFYPDLNSTVARDVTYEEGGSFSRGKPIAFKPVSDDEESFFNLSSLKDIKKETKDDRLDELKRRNSLYPHHLQSSYPLEADLTPSANKNLYVKNQENGQHSEAASEKQDPCNTKKRKINEVEPETQSNQVRTPLLKLMRVIGNSPSLKKLQDYRRDRGYCFIKPKKP